MARRRVSASLPRRVTSTATTRADQGDMYMIVTVIMGIAP